MSVHLQHDSINRRAGFSLLELIGVMAVVSILMAAAIPLTINVIQNQRLSDEKAALPALAEALKRGMLREQAFPLYQNGVSRSQETANDYYWWNLAARHGAGSANEARYPLGSRNNEGNVRKLYFAEPDWGDDTLDIDLGNGVPFYAITEDGIKKSLPSLNDGWVYPQDPRELRLLLLSTTNPDLPLPDTISATEFDKLWDDWAVGSDGEPMSDDWADYGLSESQWENRAAELVVQRVDLREWLCEVNIENRVRIDVEAGSLGIGPFNGYECVIDTISATLKNQNGTKVVLDLEKDQNDLTEKLIALRIVQVGNRITDIEDKVNNEPKKVEILLEGLRIVPGNGNGNGNSGGTSPVEFSIELDLTGLAPIDLLNQENDPVVELTDASSWGDDPEAILRTRYFLKGQKLLMSSWLPPTSKNEDPFEVGEYVIQEDKQTLRFDGQRWRY